MEKLKKQPKAVAKKQTSKEKMFLKYVFTKEELLQIAKRQSTALQELERYKNEKKSVVKDFDNKIAKSELIIGESADKVNNGYEHRYVECLITYHSPEENMKTYTRLDSGEIFETIPMVDDDYKLDFSGNDESDDNNSNGKAE